MKKLFFVTKIVSGLLAIIFYTIKIKKELSMNTLAHFLWDNALLVSLTVLFICTIWLLYDHFMNKIKQLQEKIDISNTDIDDTINILITGIIRRTKHIYTELQTKPHHNQVKEPKKYIDDETMKWFFEANKRRKIEIEKLNSSSDK